MHKNTLQFIQQLIINLLYLIVIMANRLQFGAQLRPEQSHKRKESFHIEDKKKNEIKNRIKQIIELCNDQNASTVNDFNRVISDERQILKLLERIDHDHFGKGISQGKQMASQYTPIKSPQMDQYRNQNVNRVHSNLYRPSNPNDTSQTEIQKLRADKIALINQLNIQIRNVNIQKQINVDLSNELKHYRKNKSVPSWQINNSSGYESELKSRVAYLQVLLRQKEQQNQAWRWQLQHRNVPDLKVLYDQAEDIRQDTVRLLKIKQARGQIQSNLGGDDAHTRELVQEIEFLRQRNNVLQKQNHLIKQRQQREFGNNDYSPIPAIHKQTNSYRSGANQDQHLNMQMRKKTNHK